MKTHPFNAPLELAEQRALSVALNDYFSKEQIKLGCEKLTTEKKIELVHDLRKSFLSTFLMSGISSEEKMKTFEDFEFVSQNISYLIRNPDEINYRKDKHQYPKLKSRFLIFALEILGYYQRPKDFKHEDLFHVVNQVIFRSKPIKFHEGSSGISGLYSVRRFSFNSSLPDTVTACILKIDEPLQLPGGGDSYMYRYSSFNRYEQSSSKKQTRTRRSNGYVFDYQDNLFLIGDIEYNHMEENEPNHSNSNYAEVMLMTSRGSDQSTMRGLILAHYPYLHIPVSTRVIFSRLDPNLELAKRIEAINLFELDEESLDAPKRDEFENLIKDLTNDHSMGNFPIEHMDQLKEKNQSIRNLLKFIENKIDTSYSKMLTP